MIRGLRFALLTTLALQACGGDARKTVVVMTRDECFGRKDAVLCSAGNALVCAGGSIQTHTSCGALACVDGLGCSVCKPAAIACADDQRSRCNASGSAFELVEECAAGTACSPGGCSDLCAEAAQDRSYLGCDYWPVFTSNSQLDPLFLPAVAIGNGNLVAAHVVISKGAQRVTELDVPAQSAQTVELAYQPELKDPGGSRIVRQGAYHLTSSVPVTVHQFNALLYEIEQPCTPAPGQDAGLPTDECFSYTNDASLLFPSTALQQDPEQTDSTVLDFIASSRPTFMAQQPGGSWAGLPGFVAVVAVGDRPANVTLRSSAFTMPSPASSADPIESLSPGLIMQRTLAPGDVLQVLTQLPSSCDGVLSRDGSYCDPGATFDLTGTSISADAPVQVIAGHDCAQVPFDRRACDHLEESMVPLHAWGNKAVVTVPQPAAGAQSMVRLVSGADANTITFDPPVREPVTLDRNQSVEFLSTMAMVIRGSGRLMVAQFLLGQATLSVGDPSVSVAVPVDQYRAAYNFVSPSTYVRNYVDIIATLGDVVTLDGKLVSGFSRVGQSNFSVTSVELTEAGAHEIHGSSASGIGIVLYGLGRYTAYLLPGGLDLAPIGPIGI